MADESFQERTEKATPRRRQKAKEEGKVTRSMELNSAIILCLGIVTIYFMGPLLVSQLQQFSIYIFSEAPTMPADYDSILNIFSHNILNFFFLLGPILILLVLIAYGINVIQVGVMFTSKPLEPKLDRLNLVSGLKRLFSARSLFQLFRDVTKLILIAIVGYMVIKSKLPGFFLLSDNAVSVFAGTMGKTALTTVLQVGAVILLLAFLDYAYQKYDFEKSIRMSKQEIKEESKETEGSPETKGRIRRIQREMSRRRMMQEIPKADVVITNPTHIAIALKYDQEEMDAPLVVAKGERLLAQKIKEIAREAGVPIVENKPLARSLFNMCEVGSTIPSHLFRAVAEVLAFVYRQKQEQAY